MSKYRYQLALSEALSLDLTADQNYNGSTNDVPIHRVGPGLAVKTWMLCSRPLGGFDDDAHPGQTPAVDI